MNIGITCYPTYGGSGTIATELGRALAQRGHKVHFITTALPYRLNHFVENVYFHEVQVFHYPLFEYTPYSLSLASKMAQVATREELDVLHVHYAVPSRDERLPCAPDHGEAPLAADHHDAPRHRHHSRGHGSRPITTSRASPSRSRTV